MPRSDRAPLPQAAPPRNDFAFPTSHGGAGGDNRTFPAGKARTATVSLAPPMPDPQLPFAAYLFDLDGTLVDTMPLHYRAYAKVFAEDGLILKQEDYAALVGAPARIALPKFLASAGEAGTDEARVAEVHARKKLAFDRILETTRPELLPAAGILHRMRGVRPCALVSSGNRHGVEAIVRTMGWGGAFGVVITGDDVARGKPDPEPFLMAAGRLGVTAADCVVYEDTVEGLESARRAGMTAVDVTAADFDGR